MVLLARLRYNGQHTAQDVDAALELLRRAARRGHGEARFYYARHLLSLDDGREFDAQALAWLEAVAEQKQHARAMLLLGHVYARGEHVAADLEAARHWLIRASEHGRDPEIVNAGAWILAVAERDALRAPEHAVAAMERMMSRDAAARRNPAFLDTWAAAYAATGEHERALELQREAIAQARRQGRTEYMAELEAHRATFEAGKTVLEAVP